MELISREMAIDHMRVLGGEDRERLIGILNNKNILPTIESRQKGKWIDNGQIRKIGGYSAECSVCGEWSEYLTNFCGNCGADMRIVLITLEAILKYAKEIEKAIHRPKGKWKYGIIHSCADGLGIQWRCSMCGHVEEDKRGMNYCPNCGADMRGEE